MGNLSYGFKECVDYCGFDNLPEGLEQFYAGYPGEEDSYFIDRKFFKDVFENFNLPEKKQRLLTNAAEAVEWDPRLFHFSKFLVSDMCSARNRSDVDN